jgi:hypothetical protein
VRAKQVYSNFHAFRFLCGGGDGSKKIEKRNLIRGPKTARATTEQHFHVPQQNFLLKII